MFYDLIIHPSRVEFVHRVFSPEKNDFTEKKLGSSDLKYKFDASMIDNGEHYEAFKQTVKELVDPYVKELNTINIVIKSSFFQMKSIVCDQNRADYMEYINWEACQLITDQPENYKFGYIFLEHDRKLIIALAKKSVNDYFTGIMHELFAKRIDCKLGSAFPLANYKEIIVYADKQLNKPFKSDPIAQVSYDDQSAPLQTKAVRSAAFLFALLFLFILTVPVALFYFAPDFTKSKLEQLTALVPSSGQTEISAPAKNIISPVKDEPAANSETQADTAAVNTAVIEPAAKDTVKTIVKTEPPPADKKITNKPKQKTVSVPAAKPEVPASPGATPVDPSLDPHPKFWDYIIDISEVKSDSIVFSNGSDSGEILIFCSDPKNAAKAEKISKSKSYLSAVSGNLVNVTDASFFFINSRKRSNYNRFLEVKAQLGIKSRLEFPNVFRLTSLEELHKFIIGLKNNNVGFKKFVIEKTDEFVSFTVYFG